jgi:hypothetical protein
MFKMQSEQSNPNEARTMAELVTPKQLVAIRSAVNVRSINAESESRRMFNCSPEGLNSKAASEFITYLNSQPCMLNTKAA